MEDASKISYAVFAWGTESGERDAADRSFRRALEEHKHVVLTSGLALVELSASERTALVGVFHYIASKELDGDGWFITSPLITELGVWIGYASADWDEINRISGVPREAVLEARDEFNRSPE